MRKHTTTQLLNLIKKGNDIDVLENCGQDIDNPTLGELLKQQLEKKNKTISWLANTSMIDRTFLHQIMSGARNPNRGHLLRMAIALHLKLDETQHILKIARKGELYPRIRYDAAIIFAIEKGFSLAETDEMLEKLGEPTLLSELFDEKKRGSL